MLLRLQEKKTLKSDGSETSYFKGFARRGRLRVKVVLFGPFEGPNGRFAKARVVVRLLPRYRRYYPYRRRYYRGQNQKGGAA